MALWLKLVSRGQTAYFSFGVGAGKNKGLAYYRCMFCAENRQILAIVDWPLTGVNSLQRHSNDAFKLYKLPCMSFAWNIFEDC